MGEYCTRNPALSLQIVSLTNFYTFTETYIRPLVKEYVKHNNFLISQPKHMLWVLKRTVSMR